VKALLYRILLFITYNPYLLGYNFLTWVETFWFIFDGRKNVSFLSSRYRDYFMRIVFQRLFNNGIIKVEFNGLDKR